MTLKAKVEAIVYAAEEPVTIEQIAGVLSEAGVTDVPDYAPEQPSGAEPHEPPPQFENSGPVPEDGAKDAEITEQAPARPATSGQEAEKQRARALKDAVRRVLEELTAEYARDDRAIEIRAVAGGYRMATKPEHHDVVRIFARSLKPPMRLSLQALETLAVIAYKQPVTAPEISEIRGVDSSGVLGSLIARKLIATAGRKQVIGRPILYKTSKEFLLRFGLKDVNELPSIEEFEKLAMHGELFSDSSPAAANANPGEGRDGEAPAGAEESTSPDAEHS